jgi:hypothetical protein
MTSAPLNIPDHINSHWIASLEDKQLVTAEAELHAAFRTYETPRSVAAAPGTCCFRVRRRSSTRGIGGCW